MRRIAAVVVTYNRKEKLRNCIEAICRQTASEHPEIFIVDNNSSDGTAEMVRDIVSAHEQDTRIIYRNTGYNSGGAGGFCYGIRKAVEAGYTHLWLMDDDCVPEEAALEEFLKYDAEHSGEYGFLSSKVLWTDGSLCTMNVQRETVTRNLGSMPDTCTGIEMASFVSLFLPADVVRDVGLPFREFFIWSDDWEYTRRISAKYPCMVVPSSVVVHDTPVNCGADISRAPEDRVGRFRYLYRNDVYLYRREGVRGLLYEAARLPVHMIRVALSDMRSKDKMKRIGTIIRGTYEGMRFWPTPDRPAAVNPGAVNCSEVKADRAPELGQELKTEQKKY